LELKAYYYKIGNYLAFAIVGFFIVATIIRLYPFSETNLGISNGIDDWFRYWDNAKDISKNGLLMPSQSSVYYGPGSFLYNYFLAFCFLLFGENLVPIYFIQSSMLAFSILLIYYAFRKELGGLTSILLLLTLFLFALLDTYKYYTFRLLSENLAIFTLATFVYFVKLGFDKNKVKFQFLATFFLLLSVLIRPTIFPISFAYAFFLVVYYFKNPLLNKTFLLGMLLLLFSGISILGFRNYLISGDWIFLPSEGISDSWKQLLSLDVEIIYKKTLFAFGFLSQLNPDYYPRPHWFLLLLLYFAYLFNRIKNSKTILNSEILFNVFIISFYVLTILFVTVDSYGFRAFLPNQFMLIAVSFLLVKKLIHRFRKDNIYL
jgi:hypothetical protein